ncbi:hypothetical protein NMG60_11003413 [Bertholletia excelsa]
MEIASRHLERENPSPLPSPNSNGSSSNSNGVHNQAQTPPINPRPVSRSEPNNPYPTTFVQADTGNFKQVVQMLTGSSETAKQALSKPPSSDPPAPAKGCIPPIKTGQKKQIYERRNNLKNGLMISPLIPGLGNNSGFNSGFSPRNTEVLSPSILDFPALVLSPVTPLNDDPFNKSSPSIGSSSEEERAIAEKRFYLHPSPRTTPRGSAPPQLLPLFPETSPRVSETKL